MTEVAYGQYSEAYKAIHLELKEVNENLSKMSITLLLRVQLVDELPESAENGDVVLLLTDEHLYLWI